MKKKILAAFDDPGGGLAVVPVINELIKNKDLDLKIYSGKLSEKFLSGSTYGKIESDIDTETAEEIIDSYSPDLLITATGGGNAEQFLRNVALKRKIKSVVILDFWKDYKRRWLYADYELKDMKDKVCVMDGETKTEMKEEGFPEKNIEVTGHPYLDKIFNYDKEYRNPGPENKDEELKKILFLSQPLNIIGLQHYKTHPLSVFLSALKKITDSGILKYSVTIKPHPNENDISEIKKINDEYLSERLEIKITEEKEIIALIESSDIIIGYNTIAMFEARSFNKRTISLRIAPVRKSLESAMEKAGIEIAELNAEDIISCLSKENNPPGSKEIFNGGIRNTVKLILKELNLN